ncbi:MAG: hypothetical protein KDD98_10805 [Sphingomonadaceae bacterium]|nr:hypothetical protein [Sphingomonadaceae bacterium]
MVSGGRYRLDLVGPFGLFGPDGRRIEISSRKSVALLALLATAPGGRHSREYLRSMLWGESDGKRAQASLRREVSNLAKILARQGAGHLLVPEMQRINLEISLIDVDVFALGIGPGRHSAAGIFLEGIDIPNAEEFEDWLRDERTRVEELILAEQKEGPAQPPDLEETYGGTMPSAAALRLEDAPSLPPKPSLVIVPFRVSGDGAGDWLGHALADELEKLVSQFPQIFVGSGNSARMLAEQGHTAARICQELGVSYLVEGRIICSGERIRVSFSLVEGSSGEQVWSDALERRSDDLWSVQEEIAHKVAPRIWSKLDRSERDRSLRRSAPPQGGYELYWRANALFRSWEADAVFEASQLVDRLARDNPTCPWAASLAAYCHSVTYLMHYTPDRQAALRRASSYCQSAILYGADNVEALGYCAGTIINIGGDIGKADRLVTRALHILPAFQPILFWGGWVDIVSGNAERAHERFTLALRLNPASGARAQTLCGIGFAELLMDRAADAMHFFSDAHTEEPSFPITRIGLLLAARMSGRGEGAMQAGTGDMELPRQTGDFLKLFRREKDQARLLTMLTGNLQGA